MNALTPLLNVTDATRSVSFYCEVLGLEIDRKFECDGKLVWAHLRKGAIQLMINASGERAARGERSGARTYDDAVLYFSVDDAHKLHQDLESRGYEPGPVERQDYGLDEFTLRDPDGYELGFGSPVHE